MDNKKSRTLSLTSTILLTIYTVFMVLAEVGLLAICQIMRELSAGGFDMATNSIAAGGNMAEYALPGSVFGSLFAGFGSLAWLVISSFVIFFIVICTVYIAVTAISYVLVKREYYKADAWMKIAVFGFSPKLKQIKGLNRLDFSHIKNMCALFTGCKSLEELDVTWWNTERVTDMGAVFMNCYNLETIRGLETWNTSNVRLYDIYVQLRRVIQP